MKKQIIFITIFIIFNSILLHGSEWYVSQTGTDTNDGSETTPFFTVSKALTQTDGNDTIWIADGTYNETVTVETSNIIFIGQSTGVIFDLTDSTVSANVIFSFDGISYCRLQNITFKNSYTGIKLNNSSSNNRIYNCKFESNYYGIYALNNSSGNAVVNNNFDTNYRSIYLYNYATYNYIINNSIFNSLEKGILLKSNSNLNVLSNNLLKYNSVPIELESNCINNTLKYNNLLYNESIGDMNNSSQAYLETIFDDTDPVNSLPVTGSGYINNSNISCISPDTDIDNDGVSDNGTTIYYIGYFDTANPFNAAENNTTIINNVKINSKDYVYMNINDSTPEIIWSYSDTDNDIQKNVQIYVYDSTGITLYDTFFLYTSDTSYTLTKNLLDDETYYIKLKINDGVAWSELYDNDTGIFIDLTAPELTNFAINNNDNYSTNTLLSLSYNTSGNPSHIRMSETSSFSDTTWIDYVDTVNFLITNIQETHTIYLQIRDVAENTSDILEDTIVFDNIPPDSITFTIEFDSQYTNDTEVYLNISAEEADYMMLSESITFDSAVWISYDTSSTYVVSSGDGLKNIYIKFKDNAGNVSDTGNDRINLDQTGITTTDISISSNDNYTGTNTVTLMLYGATAEEMRVSEDSSFADIPFQDYQTSLNYTFNNSTEGYKTVYVQYRDQAYNVSEPDFDTVYYDVSPPATPVVVIENGNDFSTQPIIAVSISSTSTDVYQMKISDSDNLNNVQWKDYTTSDTYYITLNNSNNSIYVKIRDYAYNESNIGSDTVYLDTENPVITSFAFESDYTTSTQIVYNMTVDTAYKIFYSQTPDFSNYNETDYISTTGIFFISDQNAVQSMYVKIKDYAGNISDTEYDTIIFDNVKPIVQFTQINNGEEYSNSTDININLSFDSDANKYIISEDSTFSTASWTSIDNDFNFILSDNSEVKIVYIMIQDTAGNTSEIISGTVILDVDTPAIAEFNIGNSAEYTVIDTITCSIQSSDIKQYQISELPDFSDAAYQNISDDTIYYVLSETEGVKTLYCRIQDSVGLVSETVFDTIILDKTVPQNITARLKYDTQYYNSETIMLIISGTDWNKLYIYEDISSADSEKTIPDFNNISYTLTSMSSGLDTVYFLFQDTAGNYSEVIYDTFYIDTTIAAMEVFQDYIITNEDNILFNIADEDYYIIEKSNSYNFSTNLQREFYTDTELAYNLNITGDDTVNVFVRAFDKAGNVSVLDTITVLKDITAPLLTSVLDVNISTTTVTLSWTEALDTGTGVKGYKLYKFNKDFDSTVFYLEPDVTSYIDTNTDFGETYYYYIVAYDSTPNLLESDTTGITIFIDYNDTHEILPPDPEKTEYYINDTYVIIQGIVDTTVLDIYINNDMSLATINPDSSWYYIADITDSITYFELKCRTSYNVISDTILVTVYRDTEYPDTPYFDIGSYYSKDTYFIFKGNLYDSDISNISINENYNYSASFNTISGTFIISILSKPDTNNITINFIDKYSNITVVPLIYYADTIIPNGDIVYDKTLKKLYVTVDDIYIKEAVLEYKPLSSKEYNDNSWDTVENTNNYVIADLLPGNIFGEHIFKLSIEDKAGNKNIVYKNVVFNRVSEKITEPKWYSIDSGIIRIAGNKAYNSFNLYYRKTGQGDTILIEDTSSAAGDYLFGYWDTTKNGSDNLPIDDGYYDILLEYNGSIQDMVSIYVDNTPPQIEITSHLNYFISDTYNIGIEGKTIPKYDFFVNDNIVTSDSIGLFLYNPKPLSIGINKFKFSLYDEAGNANIFDFYIIYDTDVITDTLQLSDSNIVITDNVTFINNKIINVELSSNVNLNQPPRVKMYNLTYNESQTIISNYSETDSSVFEFEYYPVTSTGEFKGVVEIISNNNIISMYTFYFTKKTIDITGDTVKLNEYTLALKENSVDQSSVVKLKKYRFENNLSDTVSNVLDDQGLTGYNKNIQIECDNVSNSISDDSIQLMIDITDSDSDGIEDILNIGIEKLGIYYWNESKEIFEFAGNVYDSSTKKVISSLSHLSVYSLLSDINEPVISGLNYKSPEDSDKTKNLRPAFTINISDSGSGIDTETLYIILDNETQPAASYNINDSTVVYQPLEFLTEGNHNITIQIRDRSNNLMLRTITVNTESTSEFIRKYYVYPNPSIDNKIYFYYVLKDDADVTIKIYNVAGELIDNLSYIAGTDGGRKLTNNLEYNINNIASGVYIYRIEGINEGNFYTKLGKFIVIK